MDDDVAGCQRGEIGIVEPESVGAHVAVDRDHAALDHRVEGVAGTAQFFFEAVERVVFEDLATCSFGGATLAAADEQHQLAIGHAAQQTLNESRSDEACRARNSDALAGQLLSNHGVWAPRSFSQTLFYHMVDSDGNPTWHDPISDP